MADINWNAIRGIDGSQQGGFEELCAQLARQESPSDANFDRTGSPDSGVECYCVLPSGDEWGWQAKHFTAALRESQWKQLDRSIKSALCAHPRLTRYFVCIPRNRSDGRRANVTTEMDRWKERVDRWQGWAADRGMEVEFVWWGASELTERLADQEQAGRVEFWFGDLTHFSQGWFHGRLDEAIESAGPRYTPEVHIDLAVAERLRLIGREGEVLNFIKADAREIRGAFQLLRPREGRDANFDEQIGFQRIGESDERIRAAFHCLDESPDQELKIGHVIEHIDDVLERIDESLSLLSDLDAGARSASRTAPGDRENRPGPSNERRNLLSNLRRALRVARGNLERAEPLVNENLLILTGEAGTGKTHLLCDIARRRVASRVPTVLLTGQRFLTKEAPWVQALQQLDLANLKAEQFLGALEAAAQTANARALLMIDAINEGEGPAIWPVYLGPFLQRIENSPWLACVISVRSPYDESVIPEQVRARALTVTHAGFGDRSYDAARAYFEHYGLNLPSTPLLQPEFENPLFLKLFCQGLQGRGFQELPRHQYGITEVFDGLLEDVNQRLGKQLDYNPDGRPIHAALSALAAVFAERQVRWIPQRQAADVADRQVPSAGFSASLYRALVSEGLLLENPHFRDPRGKDKVVSIGYERLADHMIAEHLINSYVDKSDPSAAFQSDGRLAFLIDDENFIWRGVLEAMCTQIPERFGIELPRLLPELHEARWGHSAFLTSLTWRSSEGRTDDERHQFIELLRRANGVTREEVFDTLLLVATFPDHALNADYLHEFLQRWSMPDRDARWSVYLHETYTYGEGRPVDRMLDWANGLSAEARDSLPSDVVDLAATALAWMLTTSNRLVRDRATKGLAWLLTDRANATARLVERFRDIDDLYVVERVYAVAYGVATRCHEPTELGDLATIVYESVFADGEPTPHILLRDYARGVVERSLHLDAGSDIDAALIRPPYHSDWPNVPSDEELNLLAPRPDLADVERFHPIRGEELIHFSVMEWDFARYILGSDRNTGPWLARRLDEERWRSPEERMAELEHELPNAARKALQTYRAAKNRVPLKISFMASGADASESVDNDIYFPDRSITDEQYEAAVGEADRARDRLLAALVPPYHDRYLAVEQASEKKDKWLDTDILQRYVLWRVFDLGWSVERFGSFDLHVNERHSRESKKPERIGKKYQWIAYHEILAHIADRYQFDTGYSDDPSRHNYNGPWQIYRRDIDPTAFVPRESSVSTIDPGRSEWWRRPAIRKWHPELSDREWLGTDDDLPQLSNIIRIKNPETRTTWLDLRALHTWREPLLGEPDEDRKGRREVWIHANAYLVDAGLANAFYTWAQQVDFLGRWMPEPQQVTSVFLGEHGWAPGFTDTFGGDPKLPIEVSRAPMPCPAHVHLTASEYLREAGDYDGSIEQSQSFLVPQPMMISGLGLRWRGNGAEFRDSEGQPAAFDPDPTGGNASLLVREELIAQFLESQELALVWTVLGERMTVGGRSGRDWTGSLHITGAFRFMPDANADHRIQGQLSFRQRFPESQDGS